MSIRPWIVYTFVVLLFNLKIELVHMPEVTYDYACELDKYMSKLEQMKETEPFKL